jgi:hypothetical protein
MSAEQDMKMVYSGIVIGWNNNCRSAKCRSNDCVFIKNWKLDYKGG